MMRKGKGQRFRRTAAVMCVLLLLLCAAVPLQSCGGSGEENTAAATDAVTETESVSVTTAETVPETESESVTDTDTDTETPTESPEEAAARRQEQLDALYAAAEDRVLPIGGWGTPASSLREVYTNTAGSYDAVWQLLADAHLNFMISLEEWSSPLWTLDSASSAYKAGMKLWYNCSALDAGGAAERINSILESGYAEVLDTVYLKDEPTYSDFAELKNLSDGIRAGVSERGNGLSYFANLLPTYASGNLIANNYRKYVQDYIATVKPDVLMFDYYPFASGDTLRSMLVNNAIALQEANAAGIPLYTFVQSSGMSGGTEPTEEQLRLNVNLNLATGSKGIAYFTVCETYENWGFTPAVTAAGETTALYDKIKSVNEGVLAMKGVYLEYTCRGIMADGYSGLARDFKKNDCGDFLLSSFGELTGCEAAGSGKFIIGCFENDAGERAYYVVNMDYKKEGTVTLHFADSGVNYTLWGSSGLTDMGEGVCDVTLTLAAGDGAFLRLESPAA
jgi:hypothetical protein